MEFRREFELTADILGVLLMNNIGQVTTIVQNHVQWLTIGEHDRLDRVLKSR
jgi:hypothetical protein